MTSNPTPLPDEPEPARPELHVVRDTDNAALAVEADAPTEVEVPPETPAEVTGPVPVVDADGEPVAGKAPLDVRIRSSMQNALSAIPALNEAPASFTESLEYSQRGDWCASDSTAKRVAHGLATVVAYIVTYPVVDLLGKARSKPIGFVLAVVLVITVLNIL